MAVAGNHDEARAIRGIGAWRRMWNGIGGENSRVEYLVSTMNNTSNLSEDFRK